MNGSSNDLSLESLQAQLIKAREENEALRAKAAKKQTLSLKVSEKGACSLYGIGRFPVSLYSQQWERVLGHADEIRAFLEANKGKLSVKE